MTGRIPPKSTSTPLDRQDSTSSTSSTSSSLSIAAARGSSENLATVNPMAPKAIDMKGKELVVANGRFFIQDKTGNERMKEVRVDHGKVYEMDGGAASQRRHSLDSPSNVTVVESSSSLLQTRRSSAPGRLENSDPQNSATSEGVQPGTVKQRVADIEAKTSKAKDGKS